MLDRLAFKCVQYFSVFQFLYVEVQILVLFDINTLTYHIYWFCQIKKDDDQHRIMYREGPQGTPFHTMLIEGYVDGPIDMCK